MHSLKLPCALCEDGQIYHEEAGRYVYPVLLCDQCNWTAYKWDYLCPECEGE